MMKLAIFALVALLSVVLAKPNISDHRRERLGKFVAAPFSDLYKTYSFSFVVPNISPAPSHDDVRYYRPSADVCHKFFTNFVNMKHKISDFDQLVVLDACLGYVIDGVYLREIADGTADISPDFVSDFDEFRQSLEITKLYQTNLEKFSVKEKTCVADLLLHTIHFKIQFPGVRCNNHIVQAYIQFAECQSQEKFENLRRDNTKDPYVRLIYELLKERAEICFNQDTAHIQDAARDRSHKTQNLVNIFSRGNKLKKQQSEYKWPKEVSDLLSII